MLRFCSAGCLSVWAVSVRLSVCLSVPVWLSVYVCICLYVCLSARLSVSLSVSVCVCVCLSVCPSVCQSVSLSVMCVCVCVRLFSLFSIVYYNWAPYSCSSSNIHHHVTFRFDNFDHQTKSTVFLTTLQLPLQLSTIQFLHHRISGFCYICSCSPLTMSIFIAWFQKDYVHLYAIFQSFAQHLFTTFVALRSNRELFGLIQQMRADNTVINVRLYSLFHADFTGIYWITPGKMSCSPHE